MKKLKLTFVIIILSFLATSAQDEASKDVMKEGSIDEQFEYVMKKSYKYNEGGISYRVVKTHMLTQLESNVDAAMDKLETDLSTANNTIETQQTEIGSLKEELLNTNNNLEQVNKEKSNMSFLGTIPMKKAMYRTIMWAIITGLVIFLLFFISSFLRSNAVTRQTKNLLEKTREEFAGYKQKSIDEEMALRRKLQDEINKRL
ncbi:MAG: hypothetical protein GY751_12785 [Bacteroidetes bacterium]|nr:hypothetical protein [Bacteroidota bacterium]